MTRTQSAPGQWRRPALSLLLALAVLGPGLPGAWAAPDGPRERERERDERPQERRAERPQERHAERPQERQGQPQRDDRRAPVAAPAPPQPAGALPLRAGQWWDGAHGHAHAYPAQGMAVHGLPAQSRDIYWSGVRYGFHQGVWYAPGPRGFVVVRPPYGAYVSELPLFRTLVVVGGLSYLYCNGVYYRDRFEGGYEVVPTPVAGSVVVETAGSAAKQFVYPRLNQSAETQASDEYECHRWAVTQSGFDPTAAAAGGAAAEAGRRADYARARGACLDGRGYTVR